MILFGMFFLRHNESVEVELPRSDMAIDPRPNNGIIERKCRFECVYHENENGTTVTLKRLACINVVGLDGPFEFRVYDPAIENVPDFNSSTYYIYKGVDGERVPLETIVVIIDPSVRTIKESAFIACRKLKKCIMHDDVHTIERLAFLNCSGMKVIRLSRTLKRIGYSAFNNCSSLETLFLPSSLEVVEDKAFAHCERIRILSLPLIDVSKLGEEILCHCNTFFETANIHEYEYEGRRVMNNHEVNQSLLSFYFNLPPLHKTCLDSNVTAQTISVAISAHGPETTSITDHDGMTALHILAMNPYSESGSILACLHANIYDLFARDNRDKTPLDYLFEYDNLQGHTSAVLALCIHRDSMME